MSAAATLLLFAVARLCFSQTPDDLGELILVQAVFRHGDRGPYVALIPYEEAWKSIGISEQQLTEKGVTQHEEFGKYLRTSYIEEEQLISPMYNFEEIFARSTDTDRTLQSASALLSTLYPDTHIPIHSVSRANDRLLTFYNMCPSFAAGFDDVAEELSQELEQKEKGLLDQLQDLTGIDEVQRYRILGRVYDNAVCMIAHNVTFDPLIRDNMEEITTWVKKNSYYSFHAPIADTRGKVALEFLEAVLLNMEMAKNGTSPQKLFLFSAHDTTMIGVFDAFGMIDGEDSDYLVPQYAISLIIELRFINGEYVVLVKVGTPKPQNGGSWSKGWTYDAQYVEFGCPNLESQCSLDSFTSYVDSRPPFSEGCCELGSEFSENNCEKYYMDEVKENYVCSLYYRMCPASSCGAGYVFSEAADTCLNADLTDQDITETQPNAEKNTVIHLLTAAVITLSVVCVVLGVWICWDQKRFKRYANLQEDSRTDLANNMEMT